MKSTEAIGVKSLWFLLLVIIVDSLFFSASAEGKNCFHDFVREYPPAKQLNHQMVKSQTLFWGDLSIVFGLSGYVFPISLDEVIIRWIASEG